MTLLQGEYIVRTATTPLSGTVAVDRERHARSHLLQSALERLGKRDDLFEIEDSFMGTGYRLRAHVFSEAELAEYRNRIITEFLWSSGRGVDSASVRMYTEDNNKEDNQ